MKIVQFFNFIFGINISFHTKNDGKKHYKKLMHL
jgi:hypothetical protein